MPGYGLGFLKTEIHTSAKDMPSPPDIDQLFLGCASLGGRIGRRDSLRVLDRATEAGITRFDTARAYGFGEGEAILGQYLKGRRQQYVVCTKAGIQPRRYAALLGPAKAAARSLAGIAPGLRRRLQSLAPTAVGPTTGAFSATDLRRSLHTSLRALRTDYVDIFLLHAAPMAIVESEETFGELLQLRQSGKARRVGISGSPEVVLAALDRWPNVIDVVQYSATLLQTDGPRAALQRRNCLRMLYQPLDGGRVARQLANMFETFATEFPAALQPKLASNALQKATEVALLSLLSNDRSTFLLTAMHSPATLAANVSALLRPSLSKLEIDVTVECLRALLPRLQQAEIERR